MKLTESVKGMVTVANGTKRFAWKNTYQMTTFHGDGTFTTGSETRVEFALDANAASGRGRRYRKTTEKQAETFVAD